MVFLNAKVRKSDRNLCEQHDKSSFAMSTMINHSVKIQRTTSSGIFRKEEKLMIEFCTSSLNCN